MRFQRYSVFSPSGFGGLPALSFQPILNGKNHDDLFFSWVHIITAWSSTAK
jgi:hypothetical protein